MGLPFERYRDLIDLTPYPRPALLAPEDREAACDALLKFLLRERGLIAAFSATYERKRELVRSYMNLRAPNPVPKEILDVQDSLFWTENEARGIVTPDQIGLVPEYGVGLWEGDVTRLGTDAIVNAGNRALLGCFLPLHGCVDNAIHSAAGMQLRGDCQRIVNAQGHEEDVGDAKITRAYNLPARYVIHTVGPMVGRELTDEHRADLRSCYASCLNLAEEAGLRSVAFSCIATGVFNFPHDEAAEIAVGEVLKWKMRHRGSGLRVVFNTYRPEDTAVYRTILGHLG